MLVVGIVLGPTRGALAMFTYVGLAARGKILPVAAV